MRQTTAAAALALAAAIAGGPAHADTDLSQVLLTFFENGIHLDETGGHEAHFLDQGNAKATIQQVNTGIASQFSTYPIVSSAGGFTYEFDPALGVERRSSESFGPLFAERPQTLGKGKLNVGTLFLHAGYDSFEGFDLGGGRDLSFTLVHVDEDGGGQFEPYFEGDLIETQLAVKLSLDTDLLFASYGLTDRLDVALALPVVRAEIDAVYVSTILPLATGAQVHEFAGGALRQSFRESASATGIGDVVARAKWNVHSSDRFDLALAGDLRLPTGDEKNLLGTGTTQAKLFLVASGLGSGSVTPHVNLGYTATLGSSDLLGDLPDEINWAVGFDAALQPRLTVSAELLGRTMLDATRLGTQVTAFQYNANPDPAGAPLIGTAYFDELTPYTGNLSTLHAALGMKWNVSGAFLLNAGAVVTLDAKAGLQDTVSAIVGVDYSF